MSDFSLYTEYEFIDLRTSSLNAFLRDFLNARLTVNNLDNGFPGQ